jgi:hypothetical protein
MRYRDLDAIDLGAARKAVCAWLDEHQGGTLAQMAEDLKCRYPAHPDEMAVILRGMMAAELRRRTRPESGFTGECRGERRPGITAGSDGRTFAMGKRRHEASPIPGRASGRSVQLAGDGPSWAVHRSHPARRDPGGVA